MRRALTTMAAAITAVMLTACALLAPLGKDDEARRAANVTLAAYETMQQAILIYGRLPTCFPRRSPEGEGQGGPLEPSAATANLRPARICKDKDVWAKIKIVEATATQALAEATPVLNGSEADAGQLVAALMAIENVKNAVKDAQTKFKGGTP